MKWNEWFEGFDLEPLQSDLSELCGNLPMSWEWVSLSKWLEMSDLTKPYQNEWNRWEMNELRWIEWNEWIEGFDFVNPMARSLWSEQGVPMKVTWDEWFDQTLSKWSDSMRNEWSEVKWVKWSEMNDLMEMTWNNPMGMVLWSSEGVPMRVTWDEWFDQTLSKWMESMRNEWIEWIEVNRGKMSDLMDLMRSTLWKSPYGR